MAKTWLEWSNRLLLEVIGIKALKIRDICRMPVAFGTSTSLSISYGAISIADLFDFIVLFSATMSGDEELREFLMTGRSAQVYEWRVGNFTNLQM